MPAVCQKDNQVQFEFQPAHNRRVVTDFQGGQITSGAGALLLREVEAHTGFLADLAECFSDQRHPGYIDHDLEELIRQRILGIACGYEDLNDHDQLRDDPMWSLLAGKDHPATEPAAGKSTLNRLEVSIANQAGTPDRYHKIELDEQAEAARQRSEQSGKSERVFAEFFYQTLDSWSRRRRVIGKAEHGSKGANPRFVVTSLSGEDMDKRRLYEEFYCARGEAENRIKEQQLYLFADRTSCTRMAANQLRLWFSSVACWLVSELRRLGLAGTQWVPMETDHRAGRGQYPTGLGAIGRIISSTPANLYSFLQPPWESSILLVHKPGEFTQNSPMMSPAQVGKKQIKPIQQTTEKIPLKNQ